MNPKYAESLLSLKNAQPGEIPQFPEEAFQKAMQELSQVNGQLKEHRKKQKQSQSIDQGENVMATAKTVAKLDTIYRLKRFMLLTLESRCKKIEEEFWNYGGEIKPSEVSSLAEFQKAYLLQYKNLVNNYIDETDLQLLMDFEPPLDAVVEIRVVNDCGQIMELAEQGIKFQKNSVYYIQKRLVEKLILKGDVVVIG